jgi:hypothetical protein
LRNGFDLGEFGHAFQDTRSVRGSQKSNATRFHRELGTGNWQLLLLHSGLPLRRPIRYAKGYTSSTADLPRFSSLSASGATSVCDPGADFGCVREYSNWSDH